MNRTGIASVVFVALAVVTFCYLLLSSQYENAPYEAIRYPPIAGLKCFERASVTLIQEEQEYLRYARMLKEEDPSNTDSQKEPPHVDFLQKQLLLITWGMKGHPAEMRLKSVKRSHHELIVTVETDLNSRMGSFNFVVVPSLVLVVPKTEVTTVIVTGDRIPEPTDDIPPQDRSGPYRSDFQPTASEKLRVIVK